MNSEYVTTSKPGVGGCVFVAPLGSTLPTDATTALDPAFKSLGYISEDGLTNSPTKTYNKIKAFGGATVDMSLSEYSDVFTMTLIEGLNVDVLKTVYGDANVSGTLSTGLSIKHNADEDPGHCYVVETILKGGKVCREVLHNAKITEIGQITYNSTAPVAYACTIEALQDAAGTTHNTYIK